MSIHLHGFSVPELINHVSEHLSTDQTIALVAGSSAIAIGASVTIDPNWTSELQLASLSVGILVGLVGLVLGVLKTKQQLRQNRQWNLDHPDDSNPGGTQW